MTRALLLLGAACAPQDTVRAPADRSQIAGPR